MRQPPEQTPPLLFGPDDVTEGYYELEAIERNYTLQALRHHRAEVALWYRALTLYRRGMLGTWEYPGDDQGTSLTVWGLQGQLLGLGVSSAKAGLDALLAGYYSVAYASVRHMLETFVQCLYVVVAPGEAQRWYRQPGGPAAQAKTPGCSDMVRAIKKHPDLATVASFIDRVKASWDLMSKGSHPTGEGITQTSSVDEGRYMFGPTHDRDLALVGFYHGLFALSLLLQALSSLRPQDSTWTTQAKAWDGEVAAWRQALAVLLRQFAEVVEEQDDQ